MSASTDTHEAFGNVVTKTTVAEPTCANCGHGALAHALIGPGTCAVVAPNYRRLGEPSECPCERFWFIEPDGDGLEMRGTYTSRA